MSAMNKLQPGDVPGLSELARVVSEMQRNIESLRTTVETMVQGQTKAAQAAAGPLPASAPLQYDTRELVTALDELKVEIQTLVTVMQTNRS